MKHLLIILLAAVGLTACTKENISEQMKQQIALDNIMTRVSVRQFTGERVSDEAVETILRAAMSAPSAINRQPWTFVVVNDLQLLAELGQALPYSRCSNGAALAVIPCGDLNRAIEGEGRDFWIHDVSAATENLLLAVHAQGLGAVWTGVYPGMERVQTVRAILGMPENLVPLCVVPVGVPAEQPAVKDKWNTDNIHYNRW